MTHTLGMHIFEAHAPADIGKHTNNIPPHGVSQWANAHLTIGRLRSDPIGWEQEKDESKTSRIGIKCVAKSTLLLLFVFVFDGLFYCCYCCVYTYMFHMKPIGLRCSLWKHIAMMYRPFNMNCSKNNMLLHTGVLPQIYKCNEKTATTMKNKIKQIVCTHIYHWQANAQTYRKREI